MPKCMQPIWRSLFMLSRCTQILCSAVRGIGLPRKVYFVHNGDLTVGIANPSWQTRFSACCRIGTISVLWSHDAHSVPTIMESFQAGTTVFHGSKRYDVRLATMDVPPVLNLISLRSRSITDLEICGFASRGERALERPAEKSGRIAPSRLAGQKRPSRPCTRPVV